VAGRGTRRSVAELRRGLRRRDCHRAGRRSRAWTRPLALVSGRRPGRDGSTRGRRSARALGTRLPLRVSPGASCAGEGRCLPGMAGERVRRFSVATRGRRGTRLTSRPSAGARVRGVRGVRAQARRCPDVENATRHSSCLIDAGLTAADRPEYRALQPFGQVPILEEDGSVLFESGAIVLYIGERSEALLPKDSRARARAVQWLIAALNSIEPFVMNVALIDLFYANEEWA